MPLIAPTAPEEGQEPSQGEILEKKVKGILDQNKNLNFVQRLIHPERYPRINNPNGGYSTHRMASGEYNGKGIVFPTIIHKEGEKTLKQLNSREALEYAVKNKQYIEFNTPDEAEWFADDNYKRAYNKDAFQDSVRRHRITGN